MRRILVPLGLIPLGEAKLGVAESLARAYGAELVLMHVLRGETPTNDGPSPREARALAYLDSLAGPLHAHGVHAHAITRLGDDVAATIVNTARELAADMIVLGSDVRSGLERTLRGSIAETVTRQSPVPVTVVPPDPAAGTETTAVSSFEADAARRGPLSQWHVGLRTVEVARIVGSVGRASELDQSFRSANRSREEAQRYARVRTAMVSDHSLPPVQLYKLGFGYYVLDGHHRVAAAREAGQLEVDAEVTEFVALDDAEAQRAVVERRRFENETGVTRIAGAHLAETWVRLREMVDRFASEVRSADLREAARTWFSRVYRPLVEEVRRRGLTRRFPGANVADVVAMIDAFRECKRCHGHELDWTEAVQLFEQGAEVTEGRLHPGSPENVTVNLSA